MTNEEATSISELRDQGYGYKRIADTLSLSLNTVKSFCRRHDPNKTLPEPTTSVAPAEASSPTSPSTVPPGAFAPVEASAAPAEASIASPEPSVTPVEPYAAPAEPSTKSPVLTNNPVCKQCGTPIYQYPHRRKRQFCSDACRQKWWYGHQECAGEAQEHICPACGTHFTTARPKTYCSHACYITARFTHSGLPTLA